MFDAIANTTVSTLMITFMLVFITFPGWLTGKIIAHQNRVLPVPVFFRLKIVRWVLWYLSGVIMLTAIALALRPVGTFGIEARTLFAGIALLAFFVCVCAAAFISFTATAQRLARKQHTGSAPPPLVEGYSSEAPIVASEQQLPSNPVDDYAPARPQDNDS